MLSFRVDDRDADEAQRWAESLGMDRSELLREAFDLLEEDFDEERFFVTVRRAYWQAPETRSSSAVQEPNQRFPWRRRLVRKVPVSSSTRPWMKR